MINSMKCQLACPCRRGFNRFGGSTDLALKWARIADFCDRLGRFADFNITAGRGLAENFGPDSGLFMSGSSDRRYQK